jgi:phosphotransferase system IIB component
VGAPSILAFSFIEKIFSLAIGSSFLVSTRLKVSLKQAIKPQKSGAKIQGTMLIFVLSVDERQCVIKPGTNRTFKKALSRILTHSPIIQLATMTSSFYQSPQSTKVTQNGLKVKGIIRDSTIGIEGSRPAGWRELAELQS